MYNIQEKIRYHAARFFSQSRLLSQCNSYYQHTIKCIVVGVLAGIIPAIQAAKMDPVAAIRGK